MKYTYYYLFNGMIKAYLPVGASIGIRWNKTGDWQVNFSWPSETKIDSVWLHGWYGYNTIMTCKNGVGFDEFFKMKFYEGKLGPVASKLGHFHVWRDMAGEAQICWRNGLG